MTETPVPAADRILTLDVIRGIAVMGIFSVNVIDFALIQPAYLNPAAAGWDGPADIVLWFANHVLVDEKFRTLFSILFGASTILVIDRALSKGDGGARVHYGRMVALLLLGLAHFYLIWVGDVLVSYAAAGMLAYGFVKRSVKTQLVWSAVLLVIGSVGFTAGSYHFFEAGRAAEARTAAPDQVRQWRAMSNWAIPDPADSAAATRTARATWPTRTERRFATEKWRPLASIPPFLPETLGLMLIGMAGYRSGFLTGRWPRTRYRQAAVAGIAIGFCFSLATGISLVALGFPPWLLLGANYGFGLFPHLAMAVGYAALIMLAMRPGGWLTMRVAAAGRAAFSNYLGTSILASLIFYGDGLALFGRLSRAEAWLAVPVVWLAMLAWSKPWLDRFNYGPFEWLWRSLARGRWQAMRRAAPRPFDPAPPCP